MLTDAEKRVLLKIARKTNQEWFMIHGDRVYDYENDEFISMEEGIDELLQALDCNDNLMWCRLNCHEIMVVEGLLKRLWMDPLWTYQKIETYKRAIKLKEVKE